MIAQTAVPTPAGVLEYKLPQSFIQIHFHLLVKSSLEQLASLGRQPTHYETVLVYVYYR